MIIIVQVKLMVVARLKVIVSVPVAVRVSVAYRLDGQRKMAEYQENGKVKVGN